LNQRTDLDSYLDIIGQQFEITKQTSENKGKNAVVCGTGIIVSGNDKGGGSQSRGELSGKAGGGER